MKICICCFGLFNRPKQKESLIIKKKTKKKVQKLNINDINSSFTPFQNKKRTIILENIKQTNQLSLNLNSPKKNIDSPYFSNLKQSYTKKKINQTQKSLYDLKDTFRCLFCGGIRCPCEDYKTNPKYAIEGLNCDLIYNEIYASQRPSNVLIEKYNLIKKFHENNIGLIVNLQRPGEHPYCGPNALDPVSGYSYSPSIFSSEGIKVKLSGWKDMDVPDSLYFMLDIIKEIYEMIKIKGKKVFTSEKYDVDYFIKHQCDLGMDDNKKNDFIPKIIWMSIDMLYNLRFDEKANYDNNTIYKALNGSLEITQEDYKEMIKIVDDINEWNWDSFQNNNKIVILSELLFNWLEDCVTFCISPQKVNEIFLNHNFNSEIIEITNGNNDENFIKSVNENIESNFKKLEIEIINYIATFLCNIYPKVHIDQIIEYKRMIEKISIYLLGFNIELLLNLNAKFTDKSNVEEIDNEFELGKDISIKECIDAIENLILIFEFLRIKIYYSINKAYNNKIINISKDSFKNLNITNNTLKSLITSNIESNNNSFINSKSSFTNKLHIEDNNKQLHLSILEGINYENNQKVKKTISPIKNHLIDLEKKNHPTKKNSTPIDKKVLFIKPYKHHKSLSPDYFKSKSFGKDLNDSKIHLKSINRKNIPIITINYVEKNK